MIAPSTPVTWTAGPARHPITLTGHVVSVNGQTAQVWIEGDGHWKQIGVVGARWVYEGSTDLERDKTT